MATVLEPKMDRGPAPESSDRSFGFVFAVVFGLIGGWPLWHGAWRRWWAAAIAAAFGLVALVRPGALRPLNRVWQAFGRLLHRVVSPVIIGAIFFLCVTPIGVIMRLLGKDVLSLRRRADLPSYWIVREPPGPEPGTMTKQF